MSYINADGSINDNPSFAELNFAGADDLLCAKGKTKLGKALGKIAKSKLGKVLGDVGKFIPNYGTSLVGKPLKMNTKAGKLGGKLFNTLVDGVMTVGTGGGGAALKGGLKVGLKAGAKKLAKGGLKKLAKGGVKKLAKGGVKKLAKGGVKKLAKGGVKKLAKGGVKKLAKGGVKKLAKGAGKKAKSGIGKKIFGIFKKQVKEEVNTLIPEAQDLLMNQLPSASNLDDTLSQPMPSAGQQEALSSSDLPNADSSIEKEVESPKEEIQEESNSITKKIKKTRKGRFVYPMGFVN